MVMSLNGYTTKDNEDDIHDWVSAEDQQLFLAQKERHDCIIMGRRTYEAILPTITPSSELPRIVMTKHPERFTKEGQTGLNFTDASPQSLAHKLAQNRYASALLVGGAKTAGAFLNAGLVDEILLTIEPVLFGAGHRLITGLHHAVSLDLTSVTQLNKRGTLLLRYSIRKNERIS